MEGEAISIPHQGWMEVTDEILKEDGDGSVDTPADQAEVNEAVADGEVKSDASPRLVVEVKKKRKKSRTQPFRRITIPTLDRSEQV